MDPIFKWLLFQGQLWRERRELRPTLRRRIHLREVGSGQEIGVGDPGVVGDGIGVGAAYFDAERAERSSQSPRPTLRTFSFHHLRSLPVRSQDREGPGFDSRPYVGQLAHQTAQELHHFRAQRRRHPHLKVDHRVEGNKKIKISIGKKIRQKKPIQIFVTSGQNVK